MTLSGGCDPSSLVCLTRNSGVRDSSDCIAPFASVPSEQEMRIDQNTSKENVEITLSAPGGGAVRSGRRLVCIQPWQCGARDAQDLYQPEGLRYQSMPIASVHPEETWE